MPVGRGHPLAGILYKGTQVITLLLLLQGTSQANNYTAAFAAVPCPDVPEAHAAAAAADSRTGGNASSSQPPFTMQRTSSWTPGIPAGILSFKWHCWRG